MPDHFTHQRESACTKWVNIWCTSFWWSNFQFTMFCNREDKVFIWMDSSSHGCTEWKSWNHGGINKSMVYYNKGYPFSMNAKQTYYKYSLLCRLGRMSISKLMLATLLCIKQPWLGKRFEFFLSLKHLKHEFFLHSKKVFAWKSNWFFMLILGRIWSQLCLKMVPIPWL